MDQRFILVMGCRKVGRANNNSILQRLDDQRRSVSTLNDMLTSSANISKDLMVQIGEFIFIYAHYRGIRRDKVD